MLRKAKRSPIALAALAMLYEAPMHPYRMQQLIKDRGKDAVINVAQRASLYQTIDRLEREGLIAAREVTRDEKRPERCVYELTDAGRTIMLEWMRQILSAPTPEFSEFPAAISFLPLLAPKDALRRLESRSRALEAQLAGIDEQCREAAGVPRLFLLEMELLRTTRASELSWVRSVVKDLQSGKLTWSRSWLRKVAAQSATQHADP